MEREIITINEEKCTGCGLCVPNCPEGAIQIIDGKARLISDLFCDGLGACIGHCPEGAISIEKRKAQPYDEEKVMANIVKQGSNTIMAHLHHLKEHGQNKFYQQAVNYLKKNNIQIPKESMDSLHTHKTGCLGSHSIQFSQESESESPTSKFKQYSQLTHWPIQLHLISPNASQFQNADLILAADCTAFSTGDFHNSFLKGKALIIACPKLDEAQDIYLAKLKGLIDQAKINTLTVIIMEVPCCSGLLRLAQNALAQSSRKIPIKSIVLSIRGEKLKEDWL